MALLIALPTFIYMWVCICNIYTYYVLYIFICYILDYMFSLYIGICYINEIKQCCFSNTLPNLCSLAPPIPIGKYPSTSWLCALMFQSLTLFQRILFPFQRLTSQWGGEGRGGGEVGGVESGWVNEGEKRT